MCIQRRRYVYVFVLAILIFALVISMVRCAASPSAPSAPVARAIGQLKKCAAVRSDDLTALYKAAFLGLKDDAADKAALTKLGVSTQCLNQAWSWLNFARAVHLGNIQNECKADFTQLPFQLGPPYWWFVMTFKLGYDQMNTRPFLKSNEPGELHVVSVNVMTSTVAGEVNHLLFSDTPISDTAISELASQISTSKLAPDLVKQPKANVLAQIGSDYLSIHGAPNLAVFVRARLQETIAAQLRQYDAAKLNTLTATDLATVVYQAIVGILKHDLTWVENAIVKAANDLAQGLASLNLLDGALPTSDIETLMSLVHQPRACFVEYDKDSSPLQLTSHECEKKGDDVTIDFSEGTAKFEGKGGHVECNLRDMTLLSSTAVPPTPVTPRTTLSYSAFWIKGVGLFGRFSDNTSTSTIAAYQPPPPPSNATGGATGDVLDLMLTNEQGYPQVETHCDPERRLRCRGSRVAPSNDTGTTVWGMYRDPVSGQMKIWSGAVPTQGNSAPPVPTPDPGTAIPEIKFTTGGTIFIGSDPQGNNPFNGTLDEIIVDPGAGDGGTR